MPSKYKSKLPKPPFKKYAKRPDKAFCANCGYVCCLDFKNLVYSKCHCGGTYQTYKGNSNGPVLLR